MTTKATLVLITASACFAVHTYAMRDPKEFESPYFPAGDFVITMPDNSETAQPNLSLLSRIKQFIFRGGSATPQQDLESPSACVARLAGSLERDEKVLDEMLSRRQKQYKEIQILFDEIEDELDMLAKHEDKLETSLADTGKELDALGRLFMNESE